MHVLSTQRSVVGSGLNVAVVDVRSQLTPEAARSTTQQIPSQDCIVRSCRNGSRRGCGAQRKRARSLGSRSTKPSLQPPQRRLSTLACMLLCPSETSCMTRMLSSFMHLTAARCGNAANTCRSLDRDRAGQALLARLTTIDLKRVSK